MSEPIFDHDRLDVYRLAINYVRGSSCEAAAESEYEPPRDQYELRAALNRIPTEHRAAYSANTAED